MALNEAERAVMFPQEFVDWLEVAVSILLSVAESIWIV
jgi:hypothetical protein